MHCDLYKTFAGDVNKRPKITQKVSFENGITNRSDPKRPLEPSVEDDIGGKGALTIHGDCGRV